MVNISEEQWLQYFRKLLTETRTNFMEEEEEPTIVEGTIPLTIDQVREAVKGTQLKKSPGPGVINAELIKYGLPKLLEMIRNLFE